MKIYLFSLCRSLWHEREDLTHFLPLKQGQLCYNIGRHAIPPQAKSSLEGLLDTGRNTTIIF